MDKKRATPQISFNHVLDLSDDDILEAMGKMSGYFDITPGDFREVFHFAYNHAFDRLTQSLSARDIMTRKVISVHVGSNLKDVAKKMADNVVSGVPVLGDDKRVAGVISEKDFLAHLIEKDVTTSMGMVTEVLQSPTTIVLSLADKNAKDIMTTPAVTVVESTLVSDITRLFVENSINRVPVVSSERKLVGIVSRNDILGTSRLVMDQR